MAKSAEELEKIRKLKEEVEAAISAVAVGGQSYKIGSRSLTRSTIGELKNLRAELQAEESAQEDNGLMARTYVAEFEGR